jgi:hypothetical protein
MNIFKKKDIYLRECNNRFEVISEEDLRYCANLKLYRVYKITSMEELLVTLNITKKK